jgi:hypothetical protein
MDGLDICRLCGQMIEVASGRHLWGKVCVASSDWTQPDEDLKDPDLSADEADQ